MQLDRTVDKVPGFNGRLRTEQVRLRADIESFAVRKALERLSQSPVQRAVTEIYRALPLGLSYRVGEFRKDGDDILYYRDADRVSARLRERGGKFAVTEYTTSACGYLRASPEKTLETARELFCDFQPKEDVERMGREVISADLEFKTAGRSYLVKMRGIPALDTCHVTVTATQRTTESTGIGELKNEAAEEIVRAVEDVIGSARVPGVRSLLDPRTAKPLAADAHAARIGFVIHEALHRPPSKALA